MSLSIQTHSIVEARRANAKALGSALWQHGRRFSEALLADTWRHELSRADCLLPFGWYQPPPAGMSVLIGSRPTYERLAYTSLRELSNWPSPDIYFDPESLLYPYFSAVHRDTGMLGDFVGTFYAGTDRRIRQWIAEVLHATYLIADHARPGLAFSALFDYAQEVMGSLGAANNTFSMQGGLAADIGHTIPWFDKSRAFDAMRSLPQSELCGAIAGARTFVSRTNTEVIDATSAFTIEPQMLVSGLPMVSYHLVVVFDKGQKIVVGEFESIFDRFGMSDWLRHPT